MMNDDNLSPINIVMPEVGEGATHASILAWRVREGDIVQAGDVLAEVEGIDGAGAVLIMEVEAPTTGLVQTLLEPVASHCEVGVAIALLQPNAAVFESRPKPNAVLKSTGVKTNAIKTDIIKTISNHEASVAPHLAFAKSHGSMPSFASNATQRMSLRQALTLALREELSRDKNVFLIGEEIGAYEGAFKVTEGLLAEFGAARIVDAPIAEAGFTGLAIGAAYAGLRPVVEFMHLSFAMQAFDQIVNAAAKIRYLSGGQVTCPIVFRGPNGAGARVGAQHGQDMAALFSHIPGLTVVAPSNAIEAKGLLKSAIRAADPVVFLEHELLYGVTGDVPLLPDFLVPLGRAKIVREGTDVSLLTYGARVAPSLAAAELLSKDGLSLEVIDLRTLRPLDMAAVTASVEKTGVCFVVEEGWPQGGLGAEIAARIMEQCFDALDAPVKRLTARDTPLPYAANLEALALPRVSDIVHAALELVGR